MSTEKLRKPRKPRVGEFFVYHDSPGYVYEVVESTAELVRYKNMVTEALHQRTPDRFREFHTRIPM